MKKLRNLCIAAITLIGLSSTAFAQTDSGTTPAIGTSHSYWVNSATGATHDSGVGNDYRWYITKGDLTTVNTSDFNITTVGYIDDATPVLNLFKVDIEWLAASATSTYYLHIIETDAVNGCKNHKAEIIDPFSDFQLAIVNVDIADLALPAADDLDVCAPDVALTLGAGIVYNYGTTELYYKIDATNIDKVDYVLGYNIDVAAAFTGTVNASFSIDAGTTYSPLVNYSDGNDVTQTIGNTATSSSVIIKVELVNSTGFEGTTAHDAIVKLISGAQGVALATLPADVDKKQNVPARPSTSGIGSN